MNSKINKMSIYKYSNYLDFLKNEISKQKRKFPHFNQLFLSNKSGVQNTYLSNSLKGRANLSADQLYSIGQVLDLSSDEIHYFLLLREIETCNHSSRKNELIASSEKLRSKNLATEKNITVKKPTNQEFLLKYYSDPLNKIVHVFLGLESNKNTPQDIAKSLQVDIDKISDVLNTLEQLEVVKYTNKKYIINKRGFHLPASSPLTWAHQALFRMRSIHRLNQLNSEKKYSFSVTYSADEETKNKIQAEFVEFLNKIQKLIKKAPAKKVFQLNFDLFPWN